MPQTTEVSTIMYPRHPRKSGAGLVPLFYSFYDLHDGSFDLGINVKGFLTR